MKNAALAAVALSVATGCGIFDDEGDPFDVVLEESFRVEYQVDSSQYCPPGTDCTVEPEPSPDEVRGPEVQTGVPLDIIALTEEPQIATAAGQVKSVSVKSVDYEVQNNTLTVPTSEYRIYLGPFGAETRNATGVIEEPIVTIPRVQPMDNATGTAQANEATQARASELLKTLQVSFIPYTQPVVAQGEPFPPQGSAEFYLDFNLEFVINARDVISN